jgi:hypothetical protein
MLRRDWLCAFAQLDGVLKDLGYTKEQVFKF